MRAQLFVGEQHPGSLKINAQVPAGTTGNITEVIVTMLVNGALRSGSYTTVLIA